MPSRAARANSTPTLLVFTLGADRERARRRLLPDRLGEVERALHEQCLRAALAAGRECGFRTLVSSPEPPPPQCGAGHLPQRGGSFAERLLGAATSASRGASGPLLIVATDVPGLTSELLQEAVAALEEAPGEVVVGPSPDGGFYLLGFNADIDAPLERVRWCSREARASLIAELEASGRGVRLLGALDDLDRRPDLERWVASRPSLAIYWQPLLVRLAALLRDLCRPATFAIRAAAAAEPRTPWSGRAPPATASA